MRRLFILVYSLMLLALCSYALAHDHARELGHHWEDPAYIGEVRLQIVIMAATACIIAAISFIRLMLRNRSKGR